MNVRVLKDVVLFAADTARSRAYLSLMLQNRMEPAKIILFSPANAGSPGGAEDTSLFDNITPLGLAASRAKIEVIEVSSKDINGPEVARALSLCPQNIVIFSGPAGALVKASLFETGKRFLHIHPGKLPQYRGSTTMYYSLLLEEKIWASALFLDAKIDEGPVVGAMEAVLPEDRRDLDHVFDPVIRARLLINVLERYLSTGKFSIEPQVETDQPPYYVIHPVLKHVAILSNGHLVDDT